MKLKEIVFTSRDESKQVSVKFIDSQIEKALLISVGGEKRMQRMFQIKGSGLNQLALLGSAAAFIVGILEPLPARDKDINLVVQALLWWS